MGWLQRTENSWHSKLNQSHDDHDDDVDDVKFMLDQLEQLSSLIPILTAYRNKILAQVNKHCKKTNKKNH